MKKPDEIIAEFREKLKGIPEPGKQVAAIIDFAMIYGDCFAEKVIPVVEKGYQIASQNKLPFSQLILNYSIHFFIAQSKGKTVSTDISSLEEKENLAFEKGVEIENFPLVLNLRAFLLWFNGEYEKGFETVYRAIKLCRPTDYFFLGWNHYALAVFFFDTHDFENAYHYYRVSLNYFVKIGEDYGYARSANGLGSVAVQQNKKEEAIKYFEEAEAIYRKMSHSSGLGRLLNDLGQMEMKNGNYPKALQHFEESVHFREEIQHYQGLATTYTLWGEVFLLTGNYPEALQKLEKGLKYAQAVNSKLKQINCFRKLYETHKKLGNTELALQNFEIFFELKSALMSDEAANNIKKIQTKFEKEASEKEAEIQRLINVELKQANEIIRQRNKDITDSIAYALRIQTAILPPQKIVKQYLDDSFIFYKPKDIVAGDFYWMERIEDTILFAACDCTGHGVPGAMVSVVCHNALNRAVREFGLTSPAAILDKTTELVLENFSKSEEEIQDGMDISLCSFNSRTRRLDWAGANNPLWLIEKGTLHEIKGNKQSIGYNNNLKPFSDHCFIVEPGARVYLFTDGFADQFGGHPERKLTNKKFRELILSVQHLSFQKQAEELENFLKRFQQDCDQTDDILVIGAGL